MQDFFSCVLQPDSHTMACRVTNDGNLFGGWQNESAGGQTAVLGRGRKCCEGHKTVTLVALRLGCEQGHFVGQEHILYWNTHCISCCHPYLFFDALTVCLLYHCAAECLHVVIASSPTPPAGLGRGVLTLQCWVLRQGSWRLGAFTVCC